MGRPTTGARLICPGPGRWATVDAGTMHGRMVLHERIHHGTATGSRHHHRQCGQRPHALWQRPRQTGVRLQNGVHAPVSRQNRHMATAAHHMDRRQSVPFARAQHHGLHPQRQSGHRLWCARHRGMGGRGRRDAFAARPRSEQCGARPQLRHHDLPQDGEGVHG